MLFSIQLAYSLVFHFILIFFLPFFLLLARDKNSLGYLIKTYNLGQLAKASIKSYFVKKKMVDQIILFVRSWRKLERRPKTIE